MIRIEIRKNRRSKQPFRVIYLSEKKKKTQNGVKKFEPLSVSENLPTRNACITNIKSMASLFCSMRIFNPDGWRIEVMDYSKTSIGEVLKVRI